MSERDLRLFLVLDALLDHRSVTRAASALGLTQSAVSHSLRALRARFGDPLLVRTGNALSPTPRALALRPGLSLGLAELERVLGRQAAFDPAQSTRCFTLATPDHPQFTVLPDLFGRIRREAPGLDFHVRSIGSGLAEDLASGQLDLVLAGAEVEHQLALDRALMRARVISEPFRCVVRRGHPALAVDLDLDTYAALPHVLVSTTGGNTGIVDAALAAVGRRRRVAMTVPSFPAAIWMVAATDLIATLPKAITDRASRHEVEIKEPPIILPSSDAYLWWHPRFQHDPGHSWWRQTLTDAFAVLRP
ncbi:LysR family transcriptional regulator [Methylobacterium sp. J-088]|uniref:LysR family transcriptional regulator n=1 Tax=Methylobacterium sp. J-088 TaxID=2836664 RepID=UPI001FB92B48|nr:LysR family transcriptional regulator [Methylobacterium sp. J-088]MCJ2062204.1 LysR family transcriptional regulator [Methylobacterium sp. J-088]